MAEADGPRRLLEVCGLRLARFLRDAEHKHLAWLREVEEQGMRMLDSNFGAEPELMPKTPSQRRRPKKRQSCSLKDEHKELNRRRLSRRRSSSKLVSSKPSSQKHHSKEQTQDPVGQGEEVEVPHCARESQSKELPALARKGLAEGPVVRLECQDCPQAVEGDAAPELHNVSSAASIPGGPTARGEKVEAPKRRASTSTPKAARNGDPAELQGDGSDGSPQGLEEVLFQDPESKTSTARSRRRRRSSCRSRGASLAEKCSLASKREGMIRRSISRAMSKKAAGRESSSASSRVSCQSSLEVFVEEDVTSSTRPALQLHPPSEEAPEHIPIPNKGIGAASLSAQHLPPPEQQAGSSEGSCVNPNSQSQEQPPCTTSQENPSRIWTRSCDRGVSVVWDGHQPGGRPLSLLDEKHKNSANQAPLSSPANKVVRPLKNFLQAVQRTQLLASPGSAGRVGAIKNFIKHSTPTRPDMKGDFVSKERQRLESLRKKQEAEEQRRKKVEEEKRRRQAEMKQKREERLRKALQARERVEQMEEEKKKRMEQKILQSDEKVWLSQAREERVAEEQSKKKLSKKQRDAEGWKQKVPSTDEFEQQEPLQKRREDEVKGKGKRVLELKKLVEQRQVEQAKERHHKPRGKEKPLQPGPAMLTEKPIKEEVSPKELHQLPGQEKKAKQPECIAVAPNPWLRVVKQEEDGLQDPRQPLGEEKKIKQPAAFTAAPGTQLSTTLKKSSSTSCLRPPKGTEDSRSPKGNENYGMDLNSDDSTDDEDDPRKPVPAWADGTQLNQVILLQYYHPISVDQLFGLIPRPKLEDIFGKSKPRYFKRTSSAVWHSPPGTRSTCGPSCNFQN
ncbi:inner centromere protein [Calypte anna]|uniref:inner centromere protein n=1 Tax=Calypte anna TaxID=9244 RepID=UPI0011C3D4D8|nr:inner centromere protein [Calypte anna]